MILEIDSGITSIALCGESALEDVMSLSQDRVRDNDDDNNNNNYYYLIFAF
jgi:hypothetical protein